MSRRHTMPDARPRFPRAIGRLALAVPVIAVALLASGCSGGGDDGAPSGGTSPTGSTLFDNTYPLDVSKADAETQGWKWPLTSDSATVVCMDGGGLAVDVEGTEYALNSKAETAGAVDLHAVWLDDPRGGDLKLDRTGLVLYASSACAEK